MQPRTILITGASSGIGRALALVYAREGVYLSLIGRDRERLEDTAAAARAQGAEVSTRPIGCARSRRHGGMDRAEDARRPFDPRHRQRGHHDGLGARRHRRGPARSSRHCWDQSDRRLEHGRTLDRADVRARGRPNRLHWLDRGLARIALRAFLLRDEGGGPCL